MERSWRARLAICSPAGDRENVVAGWAALCGLVAYHPCFWVNYHGLYVIDGASILGTKRSRRSVLLFNPSQGQPQSGSLDQTTHHHLITPLDHSYHIDPPHLPKIIPPTHIHVHSPPFYLPHLALRLTDCANTRTDHRSQITDHRSQITDPHAHHSVGRRWMENVVV